MVWALIVTGLMFGADGKLQATYSVLTLPTSRVCAQAAAQVKQQMLTQHPGALVLVDCVPVEKPVKS